ncbi:MAG: DNA recombination protein RmuC [Bacteroidales bacterium]|nr:DNA recombination protein RmuC [Bacteroidales bacterium]
MELIFFSGIFILLIFLLILQIRNGKPRDTDLLEKSIARIEVAVKEEVKSNRQELHQTLTTFQQSVLEVLNQISNTQMAQLKAMNDSNQEVIDRFTKSLEEKIRELKETQEKSLKEFQGSFDKNVESFNSLQKEKFSQMDAKQNELISNTEKKLEQMRETVDEKLQKTLNERIGQSFEMVSKQLESVQKGLGEMQNLAQDVGGLKKVLSNVKMRGGIGEIQLSMLLEQVLAPEQYEANVKTKKGSSDLVEFALKLPGKDDDLMSTVYLPIDAKFPKDVYEQLLDAYDTGEKSLIDTACKNLENTIKKMAKDIHDKYIDPPGTTDFGIMFLPFEGIYAEVVRSASLLDQLQREYKVIVTGPTTLAAILNSLQMGFKTLAIQKRSSEVWKVLGAVKNEFDKFGGLLEKTQKNLQTATNQLDELVGRRTTAIRRKLREVETLPASESAFYLPASEDSESIEEDEDYK